MASTTSEKKVRSLINTVLTTNKEPEMLSDQLYEMLIHGTCKSEIVLLILGEDDDEEVQVTEEDRKTFIGFQKWILRNAPNVSRMKQPLTLEQYLKLKKKGYTGKEVQEVLLQMHNHAPLLKKYVSAYLTVLNWLRRRESNG